MIGEAAHLKTPLMKQMRPCLGAAPYARRGGLLLSVSGGLDSMVLLDVFRRMAHVHGSPLRVLHVHHHTGTFADRAQALVTSYCREYAVPLQVFDYHWNGQRNFEYEAARFRAQTLRSALLEDEEAVLAHHQRDQAETLILALARGAGVASPLGMAEKRDCLLRPFLNVPPDRLRDHAERVGVPSLEDPSNADVRFFRSAVRHQVLPVLDRFHEHAEARLSGWLHDWQAVQEGLQADADELCARYLRNEVLTRAVFAEARPYLWGFVLRRFWETLEVAKPKRCQHEQLCRWLETPTRTGCFDHGSLRVYCDLDGIAIWPRPERVARVVRLDEPFTWGPWRLCLRWLGAMDSLGHALRRDGLRLEPIHAFGQAQREWLRRARVPLRVRAHLPVWCVGEQRFFVSDVLRWEQQGLVRLESIDGPPLKPWFSKPINTRVVGP